MKPLPPFSGDDIRCPKCAMVGAFTEWTPAETVGLVAHRPEHLLRTCHRCGYQWREALNPPAHDGPTIREAAADDRRWPLEKEGE